MRSDLETRFHHKMRGLTQTRNSVSLLLYAIASDEEIEKTELQLLRRYSPPWNIQRP